MQINDVQFNVELEDILMELQRQLTAMQIPLLQKTKESGNNIMVQCPYHANGQERRPSAGIRKDDGVFHCFACGETVGLPELISHCFGHDDMGAYGWQWLLKNFLTVAVEERKDVVLDYYRNDSGISSNFISDSIRDKSGYRQSDKRVQQDGEMGKGYVGEEELDKYRYTHPYMYKRRLTDEIIEMFDIGYDKSTDCITFPVRDINGNTLFLARRSVRYKYFNYPSGVTKPVYGLYELYQLDNFPTTVIICESMLDALTCWVYGKPAVALNGLGDELQFKQLMDMPCRKFILATDNDSAGMSARARIRKGVRGKIITEYIFPSDKKDINELDKSEFDNLQEVF